MPTSPNDDDVDPELTDIDALRRAEIERRQSSKRVRHGSTALIVVGVLVLVALALGVVWIMTRT